MGLRGPKPIDPRVRFESKVERIPFHTCWEWTGSLMTRSDEGHRYGSFYYGGRSELAHRVSWLISRGPIPEGLWVLHRCDNPGCVNPDHLFLGTQTDNMQDCARKGRAEGAQGAAARWKAKEGQ